jgi:hypothetical protein
MTGPDLEAARKRLKLTAAELGRRLYLDARDPGQTVRNWETGRTAVPGPVRAALEYMLTEAKAARASERAARVQEKAVQPVSPPALVQEPAPRLKTRRRG